MRKIFWVLVLAACLVFAVWAVLGPWYPRTNIALAMVVLFFMIGPFGSAWALYQCIRYEKRPLPYVIIAFLPYGFVWYYFERFSKRDRERIPAAIR